MNHLRQASILLVGGLFMSLVAPSCTAGDDDAAAEECPKGNRGCRCKSDDSCNSGLVCTDDGKCVGSETGQGGSAGAASTLGGGAGRSNGGRAGTESFARAGSMGHPMGGTSTEAGAGGEPATGGTLGRGTGGAGNAPGQAGDGASAGESGAPGSGGSGTGGTGGSGGTAGSPACTAITGTTVTQALGTNSDISSATYSSVFLPSLGGVEDEVVALQLYEGVLDAVNFHGADIGTFQLGTGDDDNYRTCSRCVVAGIDNGTFVPAKWFFATEGTLTFASDSDQMNGSPHGTLRNVVLREATYDETTFESTLVPGGDCLTLANGDVIANDMPPPPPPPPPEGWTCLETYYDDGLYCDCGCGVLDPDCATPSYASCEYCYCPDDEEDCTTNKVDHSDTSQCLP